MAQDLQSALILVSLLLASALGVFAQPNLTGVSSSGVPGQTPEFSNEAPLLEKVEITRCCLVAAALAALVTALAGAGGLHLLLSQLGFSAIGPTLNSIATAWQASRVMMPLFSLLQSLAMAGPGGGTLLVLASFGASAMLMFCSQVESLGFCSSGSPGVDLEAVLNDLLPAYQQYANQVAGVTGQVVVAVQGGLASMAARL